MVTHGLLGTYRGNMVQRGGRDCVCRYTRDHGGTYLNTYGHGGQQQKKNNTTNRYKKTTKTTQTTQQKCKLAD